MRFPLSSRRLMLAGALAAVAALSACAAYTPQTPEQIVSQRAAERWNLMRADKFAQAYEYNTPSYRKLRSEKAWRDTYGPAAGWNSAEVTKVVCESESKCIATVEVGITVLAPVAAGTKIKTAVQETWLREDGGWYIVHPL